ncbi:glycerophosphodiester phosphodiesterase family protein [Mongoliitalea daihaiensis]|uniref:glycerophosphodiester phosphodiesterase family protein n=1 Tax=Mongoliitalea daihaiensis TaxID=2782006 RepID=UPI001F3EC979|nr:glycerophosphodiester phosphodiesterase family protein [Mongoliitalea daihaiensis]UJP65573.1 glycerophosphodiester phosphodiesterase family protein [Mongoliitalea daihaiensis]
MKVIFAFICFCVFSFASEAQSLRKLLEEEQTVLFSHRVALEPSWVENSVYSLEKSGEMGFMFHEIDVVESKDGVLYVLHDKTLDRTTSSKGAVKELASAFLDGVKLNGLKERLPRLEDFLAISKEKGFYLMLDVKEASLDKVMSLVKKFDMLERVVLLTFSKERTAEALALEERFLLSVLITEEDDFDYYLCKTEQPYYLAAYINKNGPVELFQKARSLGLPTITDVLGAIDAQAQEEGIFVYTDFLQKRKPNILVSDYPLQVELRMSMD